MDVFAASYAKKIFFESFPIHSFFESPCHRIFFSHSYKLDWNYFITTMNISIIHTFRIYHWNRILFGCIYLRNACFVCPKTEFYWSHHLCHLVSVLLLFASKYSMIASNYYYFCNRPESDQDSTYCMLLNYFVLQL